MCGIGGSKYLNNEMLKKVIWQKRPIIWQKRPIIDVYACIQTCIHTDRHVYIRMLQPQQVSEQSYDALVVKTLVVKTHT